MCYHPSGYIIFSLRKSKFYWGRSPGAGGRGPDNPKTRILRKVFNRIYYRFIINIQFWGSFNIFEWSEDMLTKPISAIVTLSSSSLYFFVSKFRCNSFSKTSIVCTLFTLKLLYN